MNPTWLQKMYRVRQVRQGLESSWYTTDSVATTVRAISVGKVRSQAHGRMKWKGKVDNASL